MGREFDRRTAICLAGAGLGIAATAFAQEEIRPKVSNPRATDGDSKFEPNWDEYLTVTVGNEHADVNGKDDKAIQAAVD